MTEEFLHYIWKYRLFDNKNLATTSGESLKIIKVGEHNTDSGPDFFNSRIKIGNTEWAGNIEVHISASDWIKHRHQNDKAYDNVVLHVVYESDRKIYRKNGELIPTLELKNKFDKKIYQKYQDFKSNKDWIPCEKQISKVDRFIVDNWLDRLLTERLERKSNYIVESLKLNQNNWEETFYQHMARSFGFKVNAEPFELLAKSLPNSILAKHKDNLFQIEALLFGQAGMLTKKFEEEYLSSLRKEYKFLQQKFRLKPINSHLWKFLRLRPSNFPTIRISQFAALIHKSTHLFSRILETENIKTLKNLLSVEASEYWKNHYTFQKVSAGKRKHLGESAIDIIIINTIVPFLFVYGKQKNEEEYINRALKFLEKIKSEKNSVIDKWGKLKISAKSAYSTQALLQLKNEYCDNKKCLQCAVGNKLLSLY